MTPQLNLKNIDADKIMGPLSGQQNNLVKIGLIAGSLALIWLMFSNYRGSDQQMLARLAQEQEKLDDIKASDAANKDLDDFKSSLPPRITEFDLIGLISNYVKLHHVTITSLSPAESRNMGLYDIISVKFAAEADDFKSLMFFLKEIEDSKSSLLISSWSGHETDSGKIDFTIAINEVQIKK